MNTLFGPRTAKDRPDALVISGGGAKAMSALGAVHAFRRAGRLSNVKLAAGTSAGAVVAASVALKREPVELLNTFLKESFAPDLDLANFAANFGVDTGSHVAKWIDVVLGEPRTFKGILDDTGIELVVCVTNLSKRRAVYLGPATHPDMDVGTALRMSCAIPLYFAAVKYEGDVYVDGGLVDNFPYDYVAKRARNPLGVCFRSDDQSAPVSSLDAFIAALVQCATSVQLRAANANVFEIDCGGSNVFSFKKRRDLRRLFKTGVVQTAEWLKKTA